MIGQLSHPWWAFVLLGICAGTFSGALGLGSGIILVPVFVLLCGIEQKSAQGMALAVMVPMALVGALQYWRNPDIKMSAAVIGLVVCGALAGALAGADLAGRVPSHILRKVFAIVLVIAAVKMFMSAPTRANAGLDENPPEKKLTLMERGGPSNEAGQQ